MKKTLSIAAIGLAVASLTGTASAEGWDFLPAKGDNYTSEPTLSVIGGSFSPVATGATSSTVIGLELSMNCPLLQPSTNRIRQQASLTQSDESGTTIYSLEINPHYVIKVADNLELGFGPGLGVVSVDTGAVQKTLFGAQVGASAHYRMGVVFVGAEARYQLTNQQDFGAGKTDMTNNRLLLKVGMNL